MSLRKPSWLGPLAGVALLAACGMPGAPLPPSLDLPRAVSDLRAERKGGTVTLRWTPPRETTDRQRIRRPGPVRLCRSIAAGPMLDCAETVAELPHADPPAALHADTLPADAQRRLPLGHAAYALEVFNAHGRSAGLSNQVLVPLAPTLPPPADLRAAMTAEGVVLTWTAAPQVVEHAGLSYRYRIYRRPVAAPPAPEVAAATAIAEIELTPAAVATFTDRTFQWEAAYDYVVTAVTRITRPAAAPDDVDDEVEGEDSAPARIAARDIFPPATPAGVQAVAVAVDGRAFVDLTWAPNFEPDLAGYHVYRRVEGGEPARLTTQLVPAPAYRDEPVQPGMRYLYSVRAVDVRGNESPRSPEAAESVPEALTP
jgi:hypothetical protein